MSIFLVVLLPLIASALASLLPTRARNAGSMLAAAVALAGALRMAMLFPQVRDGGVVREEIPWLPAAGVDLVARVDGFAWTFAMLVLTIGLLVIVYSRYYLSSADPMPRFYSSFLGFMGAMLGVVLSGNLVLMVFFWELTGLFSFVLIGYWSHRKEARRGARMALLVTGAGGLCLLCGVLLLGSIVGSYDLDVVLAAAKRCASTRSIRRSSRSSCSAPSPRAPSSRSTSGCRAPWRRQRLSPPTFTRQRW